MPGKSEQSEALMQNNSHLYGINMFRPFSPERPSNVLWHATCMCGIRNFQRISRYRLTFRRKLKSWNLSRRRPETSKILERQTSIAFVVWRSKSQTFKEPWNNDSTNCGFCGLLFSTFQTTRCYKKWPTNGTSSGLFRWIHPISHLQHRRLIPFMLRVLE